MKRFLIRTLVRKYKLICCSIITGFLFLYAYSIWKTTYSDRLHKSEFSRKYGFQELQFDRNKYHNSAFGKLQSLQKYPKENSDCARGELRVAPGKLHELSSNKNACITSCTEGRTIRRKTRYANSTTSFSIPQNVRQIETEEHRQKAFQDIYLKREWSIDSRSGPGSSLDNTLHVRNALSRIILDIKTALNKSRLHLLDLPCGDFAWMDTFLANRSDVIYTGMDIVPDLIHGLNAKYKNRTNVLFLSHDIARNPIENADKYDLIFSRHLTQHLTDYDTLRVLQHFSASGSRFLLMTTFPGWMNVDLMYGSKFRFRAQNLELPPYSLAPPICMNQDGDRAYTSLWRLPLKQIINCKNPSVMAYEKDFYDNQVYTCS